MNCYSLLLGARNTPGAGRRFLRRDDALIRRVTLRHFPDGFTILKSAGGWWDAAAGEFREEESRQILVTGGSRAAVRAWCRDLARAMRQEELIVVELGPAVAHRFPASRCR